MQGFLRQIAAGRAIGSGVGRARRKPLGQTPGYELGHRVAARMVGAEALREKDPYRYCGCVDPTLPKPSCVMRGVSRLRLFWGWRCGATTICGGMAVRLIDDLGRRGYVEFGKLLAAPL